MKLKAAVTHLSNIVGDGYCGYRTVAISLVTNSLPDSSIIFSTETWLLSPLRYATNWKQYHTYGIPVAGDFRGQQGVSLLVNPKCPYPVVHLPSPSPYVLSCQISSLLVHCLYLPPSLNDTEAIKVLQELPINQHASQTNTLFCGDLNTKDAALLGDTTSTQRGYLLAEWLLDSGLRC